MTFLLKKNTTDVFDSFPFPFCQSVHIENALISSTEAEEIHVWHCFVTVSRLTKQQIFKWIVLHKFVYSKIFLLFSKREGTVWTTKETIARKVHWIPLTTSNLIHKNLFVIRGTHCKWTFLTLMSIRSDFFLRLEIARYSRMLVVTELVISGTQCKMTAPRMLWGH